MSSKVNYIVLVFWLLSLCLNAQTPAKSSKDLSKRFIRALQSKNMQAMQELFAPPALYREFAPNLKQMSDSAIATMLKNDSYSLTNKITHIFENIELFELSAEEILWKSVQEKPLNAVATGYHSLSVVLAYKNTSDTLLLEAFEHKKRWYLVDIPQTEKQKPLNRIICKYAKLSFEQYYNMALSQMQENKLEEALQSLHQAEFLATQKTDIFFQKGNIYLRLQDTAKALTMYRRAYNIDSEYLPAYFQVALLTINSPQNHYQAASYFELCLERDYEAFTSAKYLLDVYSNELAEYEKQKPIDEGYLNRHREKIIRTADKVLGKAEALSKEEKTKVYWVRANNLLKLRAYSEARDDLEKIVAIDNKHLQALVELAWIENETKNYTKALDYAKQAYELDKNNGEALSELAFAKMQLKDFKGAINDYNALFAMGKEFQTAQKYQNRGDCYKALKNNKMACSDYKQAVEFGIEDSSVKEWLKKNCK